MSQQNLEQNAEEDPLDEQQKITELKNKLNLINRDPGFREAFNRAAQNGQVSIQNIFDVINDWSIELDMDCEDAKRYFERESSPLPPEDLRDNFDFDAFLTIFGKWLEIEHFGLQIENKDQKTYWFKSEDSQPTQKTEAHVPTETSEVRDRRSHEQLVREIFTLHENETKKMFREFASLDGEFTSTEPTVARSDFPLILKNLLYTRDASLYEKDGEDFFMRNNTYSNLDEFLTRVRQDGENKELTPIDRLNFEDFKLATIKFVKEHPDLIIMEHKRAEDKKNNKQSPEGSQNLEDNLLEQIQNYQAKLQNSQSEVEKQVVRNMITTLVKQLDVLREAKEEQSSLMNQSLVTRKKHQISFSGIPRPSKKIMSEDEKDEQKMEKNFIEIFTFFCRQQYINGAQGQSFDRYSIEGQTMSIGMFLYFCQCFNLLEPKVKIPFDSNQLEQKRRGIELPPQIKNVKPIQKKQPQMEEEEELEENEENEEENEIVKVPEKVKVDAPPPKTIKKVDITVKPPEKMKQTMQQVPSKFQWWQDDLKFNKYYQPKDQVNFVDKPIDYKYLSRKDIVTLFKKVTFGKDLQLNEFKEILGLIAQKMFFNPENPSERHPNAYMRMIEQIKINEPNEFKKLLIPQKIPFGCREPDGFREPKHQQGVEFKIHSLNEEQKKSLVAFKQQRDSFIKDRASNANSTLLSVGSLGNLSINSMNSRNPKNYQDKPKHLKVDFDRQKVSWDKLENLNFNEVGPQSFKPRDLIDPQEDDEDRYYLREFDLSPDDRFGIQQIYSAEDQKRSLERYGVIKPQLRPTQKALHHQSNVSDIAKVHNIEPLGRYASENRYQYNNHSMNLKEQYLQRAQEIQHLQNQRENKIYQQIQQQQKNAKQILTKQIRKAH